MNIDNVIIREASLADLSKLLVFEQAVIEVERSFDNTLKDEKIIYYDIKKMISSKNSGILVAEFEGKLVGSGYVEIRESKPYIKHQYHSYLDFMYVDPEYRRKGITKLIIDGLIEWSRCKGIHEICLDVYDQNDVAVKAYENVGFSKDFLRMRMNLDE